MEAKTTDLISSTTAPAPAAHGFCVFIGDRDTEVIKYIILTVSLISLMCNAGYVMLIPRFYKSSSNKTYPLVLVNITASDIIASAGFITNLINPHSHRWLLMLHFLMTELGVCARYSAYAIACLERFMAMCRPLNYETSLFIRHFGKWILLSWAVTVAFILCKGLVGHQTVCWNPVLGTLALSPIVAGLQLVVFGLPVMTTTIVCLVLVIRELRRMSRRRVDEKDQLLMAATRYIAAVTIMFFLFLIFPWIAYVIVMLDIDLHPAIYVYAGFNVYGIANTTLYILLTKNFRSYLSRLLGCNRQQVTAVPQASSAHTAETS